MDVFIDMAHTVAAPVNEEHVADLSRAMQEINLGQVNPSKEDQNRRPLYTLKHTVDVREQSRIPNFTKVTGMSGCYG